MDQEQISEGIIVSLRQIMRAIDLRSKKLSRVYGLTGPQTLLLKEINKWEKISLGALARKINLSLATVSSIIDRLVKRDYIAKVRSSYDKRVINIEITPQGREVIKNSPSVLQEEFVEKLNSLEVWEQAMIFSTLSRIANMMGAEGDKKLAPILDKDELSHK